MDGLITILIIIASILLIGVIFIQNPKGGGISSDFGAAQQIGGVQKTNDFIDKTTWILSGIIAILCITMTLRTKSFSPSIQENPAQQEQTTPEAAGAEAQGNQQ